MPPRVESDSAVTHPLAPLEVIERTRRGEPVDAPSVEAFVRSWTDGTAADSLVAAWCMAASFTGLDRVQVDALMRGLIASGDRLELGSLGPTGDIQSTGGVGGSASLVAAPLAAALGVRVATIGGHGVGCTGGIIDTLQAIPGFDTDLPLARFVRQVRDVGIAITSQSPRLVPAERRLEELRDATGTGTASGVVAASVLARAIAGGAEAVVVHVPVGGGANLPGPAVASAEATLMAELAVPWGRTLRWVVTDQSVPRGRGVGNALEIREAGSVLRREGPDEVRDLAIRLAGDLAEAAGVVAPGEGSAAASAALGEGRALAHAERWVEAQGGDRAVWSNPGALPMAPVRVDVLADRGGWVAALPARRIGELSRWLGGGRLHANQRVDPVVGIEISATTGDPVQEGDPILVIHARDEWTANEARRRAGEWVEVSERTVSRPALVVGEDGPDA